MEEKIFVVGKNRIFTFKTGGGEKTAKVYYTHGAILESST
jgi:hypothetical protein